jgi:hypothetical protein
VESGPISFLQRQVRCFRSTRRPRRDARLLSSKVPARLPRESYSTPAIHSFMTSGCVRRSRLGTGAWLPSALIASGQVAQLSAHLSRAMDNGLTKSEASEALTHLLFYAGWPNVFSAIPVAKEVFEKRSK